MIQQQAIHLFEEKKVRIVWDEEQENMLAELSTKRISETANPETMDEHSDVARQGEEIAHNARFELEAKTGEKVISPLNAKRGVLLNDKEPGKQLIV